MEKKNLVYLIFAIAKIIFTIKLFFYNYSSALSYLTTQSTLNFDFSFFVILRHKYKSNIKRARLELSGSSHFCREQL